MSVFRERTNTFKTGRGVVHVHWCYTTQLKLNALRNGDMKTGLTSETNNVEITVQTLQRLHSKFCEVQDSC